MPNPPVLPPTFQMMSWYLGKKESRAYDGDRLVPVQRMNDHVIVVNYLGVVSGPIIVWYNDGAGSVVVIPRAHLAARKRITELTGITIEGYAIRDTVVYAVESDPQVYVADATERNKVYPGLPYLVSDHPYRPLIRIPIAVHPFIPAIPTMEQLANRIVGYRAPENRCYCTNCCAEELPQELTPITLSDLHSGLYCAVCEYQLA